MRRRLADGGSISRSGQDIGRYLICISSGQNNGLPVDEYGESTAGIFHQIDGLLMGQIVGGQSVDLDDGVAAFHADFRRGRTEVDLANTVREDVNDLASPGRKQSVGLDGRHPVDLIFGRP